MPADWKRVAADARRVLASNRQRGISAWGGRRYDFVCPSPTRYPFQWFWDSAFHAIALMQVDPALAKQEIRCLMQGARPDGFIPHMLLWEKSAHDAALRELLDHTRRSLLYRDDPAAGGRTRRAADLSGDRGQGVRARGPAADPPFLPLAQGLPRSRRRLARRDHPARRVRSRREPEVRPPGEDYHRPTGGD